MSALFLILFLAFLAAMVWGLIKPETFKNKKTGVVPKRKVIALGFGGIAFICLIVMAVSSGGSQQPSSQYAVTASSSVQDQIKAVVANVLQGKTNMSNEDRLRNIDVEPQVNGGYGVFVDVNADDNLTTKLTKQGIETDMADVYQALYTSKYDVEAASISAYMKLTDQYGNVSDGLVWKTILDKPVAEKVNWNADKATLELQILPGLWTTSILSPVLTK